MLDELAKSRLRWSALLHLSWSAFLRFTSRPASSKSGSSYRCHLLFICSMSMGRGDSDTFHFPSSLFSGFRRTFTVSLVSLLVFPNDHLQSGSSTASRLMMFEDTAGPIHLQSDHAKSLYMSDRRITMLGEFYRDILLILAKKNDDCAASPQPQGNFRPILKPWGLMMALDRHNTRTCFITTIPVPVPRCRICPRPQ